MAFESFSRYRVPLIVASALFMENLDSTVITTSLPIIARSVEFPVPSRPANSQLACRVMNRQLRFAAVAAAFGASTAARVTEPLCYPAAVASPWPQSQITSLKFRYVFQQLERHSAL